MGQAVAERDSVYNYQADPYSRNTASPEPVSPEKNEKPEEKPQISMKTKEDKGGSIFTIILGSALASVMLGFVVYSYNQSNTVYNKVASKESELDSVQAENVRLQAELENRMSAQNVEEYAENVLGMKKIDSSQRKYIQIQTDDVVNIPQQNETILSRIKDFFDYCVEYFRG